jgi:RNA polymerase sigma factor (sigma-70 family)
LVARLLPDVNRDPVDRAEAWKEWYAGTDVAAVLSFVRSANNTPEPDADIVQEAITTAYLQVERGRYRQRRGVPFTAYVKGIARNKIREARRRTWRTVPLDETSPTTIEGIALAASGARRGNRSRMERLVERREQLTQVREALMHLPEGRREVLERCLLGQSTRDIARGLGLSEDAVRQHKSRGLRSIRRYIRD